MDLSKLFLLFILGACMAGCKKDPPPKLEIAPSSVTLSSKGDPFTIEVKSNVSWKVATNLPDWLTLSPTSGQGDVTVQVSAMPNTKYARTWEVQMISTDSGSKLSASLVVTQPLINFDFNYTSVLLEDEGSSVAVTLSTEAEWSVKDAPEWCILSPNKGVGGGAINISAPSYPHKKERTGTITFAYYDGSASLPVVQKGNDIYNLPPDPPELIFPSNNSLDVSTYPNFEWVCSDPDDDPLTYTICISEDGVHFVDYGPYFDTQVYLDVELKTATTYYYKIQADDGDSGLTLSDVYSFTTFDQSVYADGEVIAYMLSDKPKPVMLVFTGDGYIRQDCNPGGLFEQNAAEGIEALFSIEPYKSYRDYFSVYIVFAHSLERGATQKDLNIYKTTAFGATFEDTGTSMSANTDKAFEYGRKVPGMAEYGINNSCVFMMVNQDRYAGTCWMWPAGRSVAICPVSRRGGSYGYAGVVLHEGGGHGFGRFADEYINSNTQIPTSEVTNNQSSQNYGMYLNIDFVSDPQKVLWAHFIGLPGYNRAGVFEGAAYYRYGVWRSEETNCMIDNIKYYSVACRELIVKRLMAISGEEYTLEKFLERDYVRTPGAAAEMETKSHDPATFIPLAPPIVVW